MVLLNIEGSIRRRSKGPDSLSRGSVQVRGENIYYEASGSVEEGPTILFLHESGGSAATWQGQLAGLAPGVRCLAPDLPGHGRSEGKGCGTVAEYRRVVLEFMDTLALRWPVIIAGACLGAAVAVDMAIHAPERVHGLILAGLCDGGRACVQTLSDAARGEALDGFVQDLFSGHTAQRLVGDHLKQWRLTSPLVRHGDLVALAGYSLSEALRRVKPPVVLIAGGHDSLATTQWAYAAAEEMPNACAIEIPDAGCLSMAEQPAAFNRIVLGFLSGLAPACPVALGARPGGYRRF
ncbi:MAG TPA: alpha/beta fold hydrolase [Symbiobacteriaceae bacterium]|jgi:pimeloyl-ACP methyl ester carboxylesterase